MTGAEAAGTPPSGFASFRQNPTKTVMLVALLPVMVVVWIPVLRPAAPRPVDASASLSPAGQAVPATVVADVEEASGVEGPAVDTDALRELVDRALGRAGPRQVAGVLGDPFGGTSPVPAVPLAETMLDESSLAPAPAELVPSSVMLSSAQDPIAVIRGRACRRGDEIDGFVVVSIEERRVLLQSRESGRVFTIDMPVPGKERQQ
ncbi:MAG: hypothetical protein AAF628_21250 [Planctomycetota bacterium]